MIVISDMMGTLTTGSPILGFVDWIRHKQSAAQARGLKARVFGGYALVKLGLLDAQRWKQEVMVESLAWLRGMDAKRFAEVAEWTVERNLWPKRRAAVIERLAEQARGGAQVYIASSVFEPVAERFAQRFGAHAIGTPVAFAQGRAMMPDGLVASEGKIAAALERLGVARVDAAYGDTYMDIPMLENAVHAVAVYPDRRLARLARERGWEVIA